MLTEHFYILLGLLRREPVLFAPFILFLDLPRYSLSLLSMLTWRPRVQTKSGVAPTVAAVIPVKNGEQDIRACVESLIRQSHPVAQVTIIDDGSEDGTWPELERLRAQFPGVRLLRHAQSAGRVPLSIMARCFHRRRGGISWRCSRAVNSQPRKGYATWKRLPSRHRRFLGPA